MGPDRTHNPCISNQTHYRLLYMAKSYWGSYFIYIDPESINSVFALFDCFGAILYWIIDCWAHWPGLSVRCIWGIRMGFGEQGKMAFISGEQRKKGQISRETETILGNQEYKKTKFEETEEQANLFQRNMETCTPLRGLRISLRRQNTTKVMAYNITRNSPF